MDVKETEVESSYRRLKRNGRWFWTEEMMPADLLDEGTKRILETKSVFVDILEHANPTTLVADLLTEGRLPRSLAVRHCMLATDIGMETIDRLADFLNFHDITQFRIKSVTYTDAYQLRTLGMNDGVQSISNSDLDEFEIDTLHDICTILCFGEHIDVLADYPTFDRCRLGTVCGDDQAIADYFADLYVRFSPQTRGRVAVKKGQIAESVTREFLESVVSSLDRLVFASSSRVPDVPKEGDDQEFDFVLRTTDTNPTYVAIECAFQETTNSTLERKARQSRELYPSFHEREYYFCHVVDGAGYFNRSNALKQMIEYSDIAVGFNEFARLREFLQRVATHDE